MWARQCGRSRTAARSDSSNGRPASCSWFQAAKSKSSADRNRVASSSPTAAAIAGCGSQAISTLPRSNTTAAGRPVIPDPPAVAAGSLPAFGGRHEVELPGAGVDLLRTGDLLLLVLDQ